ncbi:GNAT family N-acetyltransferase [Synechococcus sp. FGCU-3]|nr:GNAT family N-acetyltransferase [Synechococcus sp. FGCU3]
MVLLRPLQPDDVEQVLEAYADAVRTQAIGLYEPRQIEAWAMHAQRSNVLREILLRGRGMVSCNPHESAEVEAFAVLDPIDRLSLLYCRGRSSRQGRGKALLDALETLALQHGCRQMRTEASQLSKPLLLRQGWTVAAEETVLYAGVPFVRWRMIKTLTNSAHG